MNFLVQQQPAYVYTAGRDFDVDKPTVILIHGAANDHRVWQEIADGLAHEAINCLAIDLPGHGKSFADAKTRVEDYADWIINLLDNGAIKQAVLVGHSMGSLIAIDCARRYPGRVAKLILVGTAAPMPVAEKILNMARDEVEAAYDLLVRSSFFGKKNADGTWPPVTTVMQSYRRILADSRVGALANDMQACNQYAIDHAALQSIATPTLVIIGAEDRMTSANAGEAITQSLPNASSVVIVNAGHMMMAESPRDVLAAIADANE
jgi:pimeloyl-ACP methyl ester carboxylesterase